jgi:hypothetical protein
MLLALEIPPQVKAAAGQWLYVPYSLRSDGHTEPEDEPTFQITGPRSVRLAAVTPTVSRRPETRTGWLTFAVPPEPSTASYELVVSTGGGNGSSLSDRVVVDVSKPCVKFAAKPTAEIGPDGMTVKLSITNCSPVQISLKLDVGLREEGLKLGTPSVSVSIVDRPVNASISFSGGSPVITLSVGDQPVTATFRLTGVETLRPEAALDLALKDPQGNTLLEQTIEPTKVSPPKVRRPRAKLIGAAAGVVAVGAIAIVAANRPVEDASAWAGDHILQSNLPDGPAMEVAIEPSADCPDDAELCPHDVVIAGGREGEPIRFSVDLPPEIPEEGIDPITSSPLAHTFLPDHVAVDTCYIPETGEVLGPYLRMPDEPGSMTATFGLTADGEIGVQVEETVPADRDFPVPDETNTRCPLNDVFTVGWQNTP